MLGGRGRGCVCATGAARQRPRSSAARGAASGREDLKKGEKGKKNKTTNGGKKRKGRQHPASRSPLRPGPALPRTLPCPALPRGRGAERGQSLTWRRRALRPAPPRARCSGSGAAQPSSGNSWQPQPMATAEGEPGRGRPQRCRSAPGLPPSLPPALPLCRPRGRRGRIRSAPAEGRQGALCASGRRRRAGLGRSGRGPAAGARSAGAALHGG